jgi:acetyl-CoA carboxylase biotin carboxyl carrier protein
MKPFAVHADVTGTVWKVVVEVGDTVGQDQDLVILESMKMEIPACAPRAGVVLEIRVAHGDAVKEGQELLIIGTA